MFTADGVLTIYSLGDSIFLSNVLNGIAMITTGGDSSTDRGSFLYITAIGALVGIFLTALRGLQTGKAFDLNSLMLCIIAWYFFFGWNVSVSIRDVFHNEDRLVAHVPGGVALTGSAISSLGWGLTSIYEQAFLPVTAEGGISKGLAKGAPFADTAKTLNALTALGGNPALISALDAGKSKQSDNRTGMRENIINYINECTMKAVNLGYKNLSDVFNMTVVPEGSSSGSNSSGSGPVEETSALSFNNGGNIYMTSYNGDTVNCSTALNRMNTDLDSALKSTSVKAIIAANTVDPTQKQTSGVSTFSLSRSSSDDSAYALRKIDDVMGILGKDADTAQNMIKASIYYHVFPLGAASNALSAGDRATATMLEQARMQRNTQWSGEGTMFQQTMIPIMTFIEGFTYAVTPFMGLFLLLGMFGVSLSIKYFMLVAWVQSWMPCLAIANNYIDSSLQRAISDFGMYTANNATQGRLDSFEGVMRVMDIAQNHLATAGMFIGAIPIITLFIFSGSIYALSSLTSRMNGAEFINQKIATPDMISPASVMSMMSQSTSQLGATWGAGWEGGLGTISFVTQNMSSKQASMLKSDAISSAIGGSFSTTAQELFNSENTNHTQFVRNELESGNYNDAKNAVLQLGYKMAEAADIKANTETAIALGADASIGLKALGTGLSAGLKLNEQQIKDMSNAFSTDSSIQDLRASAYSGGFAKALSGAYNKSLGDSFTKGENANKAYSFQESAEKVGQQITSYQENNASSYATSKQQSVGVHQLTEQFEMDKNLQREVAAEWNKQAAEDGSLTEARINEKMDSYSKKGLQASTGALRATAMADLMTDRQGNKGYESKVWLGNKLNGTNVASDDYSVGDKTNFDAKKAEDKLNNLGGTAINKANATEKKVNDNTNNSPEEYWGKFKKEEDARKFAKQAKTDATNTATKESDKYTISQSGKIIDNLKTVNSHSTAWQKLKEDINKGDGGALIGDAINPKNIAEMIKSGTGIFDANSIKRSNQTLDQLSSGGKKVSALEASKSVYTNSRQGFSERNVFSDTDSNTDFSNLVKDYAGVRGAQEVFENAAIQDQVATELAKGQAKFLGEFESLGVTKEAYEKASQGVVRKVNFEDGTSLDSLAESSANAASKRAQVIRDVAKSHLGSEDAANRYMFATEQVALGTADAKTTQYFQDATRLINAKIRDEGRNKNQ